MCGIAGEFSFSKPVDPDHIKRMMDAIVHRGPDDEGLYCADRIGLGHRRLSIIDLTESGRNPRWTSMPSIAGASIKHSKSSLACSPLLSGMPARAVLSLPGTGPASSPFFI